jgi:hypothetical protein
MRVLAALISLGRFVFGVAVIAEPKLMEQAWIGKQARLPGAQLLARAVGARDLALGCGGLQALARDDGSARPWLGAAAICDAVDFGATWAAGRGIPHEPRRNVLAIAAVFSVLSSVVAVGVGRSRNEEPSPSGAGEVTGAGPVASEQMRSPVETSADR